MIRLERRAYTSRARLMVVPLISLLFAVFIG